MPTPTDVCRAIVQLNVMGLWPTDESMQGIAEDAFQAIEGERGHA